MKWVISILFVVGANDVVAQGTFQDLDFESANISPSMPIPSYVPIAEALPGWSAEFINTSTSVVTPQTQVVYDGISLGGEGICVNEANAPGPGPLQGNYSVVLFGGGDPSVISASISQTGIVPAGTQSLEFDANVFGAPFKVTLGGTPVVMSPVQTFAGYERWAGNIPSSMAGLTETLAITEPASLSVTTELQLDNISFSPNPITVTPEPDALMLMTVGGIGLWDLSPHSGEADWVINRAGMELGEFD